MHNDGQRASGPQDQYVWGDRDGEDAAPERTLEAPADTSWRHRVPHQWALLIGAGTLALLAGAVYGADSLGSPQHAAKTGAAAMTSPSSLIPAKEGIPTLPASPGPSQSAAAASHTTVATDQHTATAPPTSSAAHQQPSAGASPAPVGDWPLTGPASGSVSVADLAGSHPGTASNVQWATASGAAGYGVFNGTSSLVSTFGPVVNTGPGSSYTVSAWLYPVQYDSSDFMTAVSQDGGPDGDSGFYLGYFGPIDRWAFLVPGTSPASSTSAPTLNTWTHVVGVYDAADDQVRLYVNGTLEGTETYDSTNAGSTGSLVIGRAMYAGSQGDWFHGDIRDVEVFDQALSTTAVESL